MADGAVGIACNLTCYLVTSAQELLLTWPLKFCMGFKVGFSNMPKEIGHLTPLGAFENPTFNVKEIPVELFTINYLPI